MNVHSFGGQTPINLGNKHLNELVGHQFGGQTFAKKKCLVIHDTDPILGLYIELTRIAVSCLRVQLSVYIWYTQTDCKFIWSEVTDAPLNQCSIKRTVAFRVWRRHVKLWHLCDVGVSLSFSIFSCFASINAVDSFVKSINDSTPHVLLLDIIACMNCINDDGRVIAFDFCCIVCI